MEEIGLRLGGLACPDCAQKLGQILERQKGVKKATVFFTTGKVKITYDPALVSREDLEQIIAKTGYQVL